MKLYLIIFIFFIAASCNIQRYYYLNSDINSETVSNNYTLEIDSSYKFYIRQVYKELDENGYTLKSSADPIKKANLIEIEYLIVSTLQKRVIYITCVPDKYQGYYSSENYLGEKLLNVYDLNKIYFGIVSSVGEFDFFPKKNGKGYAKFKDIWKIEMKHLHQKTFLTIKMIKEMEVEKVKKTLLVNDALGKDILFKEIERCKLIFHRKDDTSVYELMNSITITENESNTFNLYFKSKKTIDGINRFIHFNNNRIEYNPKPFFNF